MHNILLQGQAPLHVFFSCINWKSSYTTTKHSSAIYLQSSDTHDKCHALWVAWWNYTQCLHILHISIGAFVLTRCVYVLWEQQRWLENMQENTTPTSRPFGGWSCSCCLSSESKMVKYEPPEPPIDELPFSQQKQKVTASLICTGTERDPVCVLADRLKPNNTDIWCEASLTLPPWSLSSSNRDWNPQNSPVVSLIGELCGLAFD